MTGTFSFYWRKPASASLQQAIREFAEPVTGRNAASFYTEERGICSILDCRGGNEAAAKLCAFCRSYGVAYVLDLSEAARASNDISAPDDDDQWFYWGPGMSSSAGRSADEERCGKSEIADFKLYEQRRSQAEPLLDDLAF